MWERYKQVVINKWFLGSAVVEIQLPLKTYSFKLVVLTDQILFVIDYYHSFSVFLHTATYGPNSYRIILDPERILNSAKQKKLTGKRWVVFLIMHYYIRKPTLNEIPLWAKHSKELYAKGIICTCGGLRLNALLIGFRKLIISYNSSL